MSARLLDPLRPSVVSVLSHLPDKRVEFAKRLIHQGGICNTGSGRVNCIHGGIGCDVDHMAFGREEADLLLAIAIDEISTVL